MLKSHALIARLHFTDLRGQEVEEEMESSFFWLVAGLPVCPGDCEIQRPRHPPKPPLTHHPTMGLLAV